MGKGSSTLTFLVLAFLGWGTYRFFQATQKSTICILDGKRNIALFIIQTVQDGRWQFDFPLDIIHGIYIEQRKSRRRFARLDIWCRVSVRLDYKLAPLSYGFDLSQLDAYFIRDLVNDLIKPFKKMNISTDYDTRKLDAMLNTLNAGHGWTPLTTYRPNPSEDYDPTP